jgi:hypothetical protein
LLHWIHLTAHFVVPLVSFCICDVHPSSLAKIDALSDRDLGIILKHENPERFQDATILREETDSAIQLADQKIAASVAKNGLRWDGAWHRCEILEISPKEVEYCLEEEPGPAQFSFKPQTLTRMPERGGTTKRKKTLIVTLRNVRSSAQKSQQETKTFLKRISYFAILTYAIDSNRRKGEFQ